MHQDDLSKTMVRKNVVHDLPTYQLLQRRDFLQTLRCYSGSHLDGDARLAHLCKHLVATSKEPRQRHIYSHLLRLLPADSGEMNAEQLLERRDLLLVSSAQSTKNKTKVYDDWISNGLDALCERFSALGFKEQPTRSSRLAGYTFRELITAALHHHDGQASTVQISEFV
jgi:hypothetical protein